MPHNTNIHNIISVFYFSLLFQSLLNYDIMLIENNHFIMYLIILLYLVDLSKDPTSYSYIYIYIIVYLHFW